MQLVETNLVKSPLARLKKLIRRFSLLPPVWKAIGKVPLAREIAFPGRSGIFRKHPIDRQYGIDTSGFVDVDAIHPGRETKQSIKPYVGSQPSIVRKALIALGEVGDCTFVDLGCGKGRALAVASEFPFRQICGVELSSMLAAKARSNAAVMAKRFPGRAPVTIAQANVVNFALPPGKLVLFNYHAFGPEIVAELVRKLEASLKAGTPHIFFVYYNPVHGEIFDRSPAFHRYLAGNFLYDPSELRFSFAGNAEDAMVVWQSVKGAALPPQSGADREIAVIDPLWRAKIAD